MKKRLLLSLALMASLVACAPNPAGTDANSGSDSSTGSDTSTGASTDASAFLSTKQAYLTFLNCVKAKVSTPQEKTDVDNAIKAVQGIPDSVWSAGAAQFGVAADAWAKAYGAACSAG